jgi:hypothetical protein
MAGATEEVAARDENMNRAATEVRDTLEALAKSWGKEGPSREYLVLVLARIYCPDRLRRKYRQ